MSIRWADFPSGSQGIYGDDEALFLNGVYAQMNGTLVDDPDPLVGALGKVWRTNSGVNTYLRRVFGGTYATVGIGFRIWLAGLPGSTGDAPHFQITDMFNDVHCMMRINPDGSISVYKDNVSGTLLATTAGPVVVANAWQHIEWKYYNNAAGMTEIRIDGDTVLEFEGNTATGSQGMAQIRLNSSGAPTAVFLKDLFMWNGLGDVANDFLGPCGVYYLKPNADVSSGWSRTTGLTDFGILDNVPPNDAQYIFAEEDPVIPAPSIVGCESLPDDIVAVRAVIPIIRARKSDGGEGRLQMSLLSGVDEDLGLDRSISTAFTYWWDVSHYDPATLSPWTPGAVDAAQFKINRTL